MRARPGVPVSCIELPELETRMTLVMEDSWEVIDVGDDIQQEVRETVEHMERVEINLT